MSARRPEPVSRRGFLTGAFKPRNAALAATSGLVAAHAISDGRADGYTFRPPGALPEPDFLASCIKCGQCVEACPFDTLSLATAGADQPIGTPFFEPRRIPCYMCEDVPCIEACPSGSLVKGTAITDADMGLAVMIDQVNCLAYKGLRCEACYRACPLVGEALELEFRPQERTGRHAFFLPKVNPEICTGCGRCEHACVMEEPAIRVLPRHLAQGKLGEHYRFGWDEEIIITSAPEGPGRPADLPPEWGRNSDDVLQEMDDLSGIMDP